jgi:hypothetical protein
MLVMGDLLIYAFMFVLCEMLLYIGRWGWGGDRWWMASSRIASCVGRISACNGLEQSQESPYT